MALIVGELAVKLEAQSREFRDELRKIEGRLDSFESRGGKRTRNVGLAFAKLGGAIGVVTAAVGALTGAIAALGLARFAVGGIQAAASFEQIGIQLETLTGSAEGAKRVLRDVNRLVVETPFGLDELSSAARNVSVVFGENADAVAEFTGISADLAAAFGRPVEQIGENLVRAFSSGLGAADVFREAGITATILQITGATDVASISGEQLADALRQITAEGGKAFGAAAAQAKSLGGAISNTGIAFKNFQRAFGDALSPVVVDVLVNVIQPAFQRLEKLIKENADTIADFARDALPALFGAFDSIVKIVAFMVRSFGNLISVFRGVRAFLGVLQFQLIRFVNFLRRIPANIRAVVSNAATLFRAFTAAITGNFAEAGRILRDEVDLSDLGNDLKGLSAETAIAEQQAQELVDAYEKGTPVIDAAADGIERLGSAITNTAAATDNGSKALETNSDQLEKNKQANLDNIAVLNKRSAAQTKNLSAFEKIIRAEALRAEGGPSASEKEIAAINEQLIVLEKRAAFKDDEGKKEQAIVALSIRRAEIATRIRQAEQNLPAILTAVNQQIESLATVDPEAATQFAVELQNALVKAGGDPEALIKAAATVGQAIRDETKSVTPAIGKDLATTIKDAFTGEGEGIASSIGDLLSKRSEEGLSSAFDEALNFFGGKLDGILGGASKLIGGLFDKEGPLGGIGSFFSEKLGAGAGKLLGSTALGILGGGISAFQKGTETSSAIASGVTSAVTSTQAVRGIVAGPTQLAVAQVDRAISDSFIETNRILARIEENTRATATQTSDTGTGSIPSGGTDAATQALANEGPSLV